MHGRSALIALLGSTVLAGGIAAASATGAVRTAPCTPRVSTIGGRRAIAYCGPATVVVQIAGQTYRFRNGLCNRSRTMGALVINVGTLVRGARGNAGRSFVSLVIAKSPSSSEAFEADAGGRQLFGESVIAQGGPLLGKGTFVGILGASFSGSWDCHGVIWAGP